MTPCQLIKPNSGDSHKTWCPKLKRMQWTYRIVLEAKLGRPLKEGEVARHKCDNRACINPDHLIPGSPADNVRDMHERGRARQGHVPGEKHGMATITEYQAKRIIFWLVRGFLTHQEIADIIGCSKYVVDNISRGRTWKHLPRHGIHPNQ